MKAWLAALALLWGTAWAQPVTVSAASSLGDAFKALVPLFEAQHPGAKLRLNTGASGQLLQQIARGAPVDVLASADTLTVEQGVNQGLLDGRSRRLFASNALVLVTPTRGPVIASLSDLRQPAVERVALGKPATVPAGRYAQAQLQRAELWSPLAAKLVMADNARQVLDYVARGEVQAGFVFRSDLMRLGQAVRVVQTFPDPVHYPAAVVKDSRQPAMARAFVDFLRSPAAQKVLIAHGFGSAPS